MLNKKTEKTTKYYLFKKKHRQSPLKRVPHTRKTKKNKNLPVKQIQKNEEAAVAKFCVTTARVNIAHNTYVRFVRCPSSVRERQKKSKKVYLNLKSSQQTLTTPTKFAAAPSHIQQDFWWWW